jgi:hypothetical protein
MAFVEEFRRMLWWEGLAWPVAGRRRHIGSFLSGFGRLAPPKFTRAWEPTLFSGHARGFERLLAELNFELWIGDAAEIRAKRVRKQKTGFHAHAYLDSSCRQIAVELLRLLAVPESALLQFSRLGIHNMRFVESPGDNPVL